MRQLNGDVLVVYGERCGGKRLLESGRCGLVGQYVCEDARGGWILFGGSDSDLVSISFSVLEGIDYWLEGGYLVDAVLLFEQPLDIEARALESGLYSSYRLGNTFPSPTYNRITR